MVIRGAFKRIAIALTLGAATLASPGVPRGFAADSAMTFQKLVEYLDLEVKEDRILKSVNDSATAFTLSDEQIKVLKSKGASDKLIEALKRKGASAGHVAAASSDITDFVLILDCSGSMRDRTSDGKTKWGVARQAALDLVNAIPNGRQLAFIAYGHNREQGCSAVEVMRPLSRLSDSSRAAVTAIVERLQPVGHTPIAVALRKGGEELDSSTGLAKVVLITDGMETCNGDPVAEAHKLASNQRLKGGLTVIGFDMNEKEAAAVAQIAKAGNGEFHDAKNAAAMVQVVDVVSRSIAQAPAQSHAAKSDVKPGKDFGAPASLELGKYASGRLAEQRGHFFALDLPAGDYVAVVDGRRADKDNSNLIFNCQLDGQRIFSAKEIDRIVRGAAKFHSDGGQHVFTVENRISILDYHFGVFPTDSVPGPFIEHPTAAPATYEPGSKFSFHLDPSDLAGRVQFVRVKLEPGDYDVAVSFQAPTARGLYGVHLDTVTEYGMTKSEIGRKYGDGHFQTLGKKLVVAEDVELLLRLKCYDDAPIKGTLSIKKAGSGEVQ
jgi:Mg-chelatase subunit ChlD